MNSLLKYCIIGLFLPLLSKAQDTLDVYDLSLEDLSKIPVYSTTRISSEEAGSASATVVIIDKKEIKERGYQSLIDIFQTLPDFKVDWGVDPRWFNDISVRGVRYSDKLILLLDGVRISSPTNEITPIFENYPLYMAERVEIAYGPVSTLYGADAFSGVINIVTKKPGKVAHMQGGISAGMYQTVNSNILLAHKIGEDWDFSMGGHFFYDKQPDLSKFYPEDFQGLEQLKTGTFFTSAGDTLTPKAYVQPEKGNPLFANSLYGRIVYKDFSISYFQNYGRNPTSAANAPNNTVYNDDQYIGHHVRMVTGKYATQLGRHLTTSQVTFSRYKLDHESNFRNVFTAMEPAYLYSRSWKFKAEQLFDFSLSKKLRLSSGITFERFFSAPRTNDLVYPVLNHRIEAAIIVNSIAPNNLAGIPAELITSEYKNVGGFAQLMWKAQKLDMFAGIRADKDDRFDLTINPRIGVVAKPNQKLILKALYGTAYLAPSPQNIFDRFGIFETNDEGSTYFAKFFQLPNPNLKPQTISTSEFASTLFLQPNLSIDLTAYYSSVKNTISPINSEEHPQRVERVYPNFEYEHAGVVYKIDMIQINDNLGESDIYGGSLTITYQWHITPYFNGDFYFTTSYVNGTTDIDEEGPAQVRNLPGVSPLITHFGATLRKNDWSLHARLSRFSKQRTIGVSTVKNQDNDGNRLNDAEYQEISGYHRVDLHLIYNLTEKSSFSLGIKNLTNQKYRNVNLGADPDQTGGLGAASAEFFRGVPQNPVRLILGFNFKF